LRILPRPYNFFLVCSSPLPLTSRFGFGYEDKQYALLFCPFFRTRFAPSFERVGVYPRFPCGMFFVTFAAGRCFSWLSFLPSGGVEMICRLLILANRTPALKGCGFSVPTWWFCQDGWWSPPRQPLQAPGFLLDFLMGVSLSVSPCFSLGVLGPRQPRLILDTLLFMNPLVTPVACCLLLFQVPRPLFRCPPPEGPAPFSPRSAF